MSGAEGAVEAQGPGPGDAGERGSAASPAVLEVRSPLDGSVVARVPAVPPEEVRARVARARAVQAGWGSLPPRDRARRLRGLIAAVAASADRIAAVIRSETGKPHGEALNEVVVSLDLLRYLSRIAPRVLRPRRVPTGWMFWKSARVHREPMGVIGVISPWNYPFILTMDPVGTALFAGNAAVLKPSETTPLTALEVERCCLEAGLPEGLVEVIPGDGATGAALVRGGVDKVFFTGSPATGRKVMAAAAETLTPVALELGGKDPALVLEDADLERAARGILFGAFYNAGQTCVSTERVYVVEAVYDRFVLLLTELVRGLRAGTGGDYDVGPLILPDQLRRVEELVETAVRGGARVLAGGGRTDPAANVFEPTLLVDVEESMSLMREETFGPVLPVSRVRDAEEALERANASPFGLAASVWTGDSKRGAALAARIRAGVVSVNDTLSHWGVPGLPMGGVGDSGFGRGRGSAGLEEMSRVRSLLLDRGRLRREPWWFPYGRGGIALSDALLDLRREGAVRGTATALRRLLGKETS